MPQSTRAEATSNNAIPSKGGSIDTVYAQIKTMMYNQELAPGQKLIYQDLSRRLKISTTPILQALNRLENAKLVRYEKNKGFFVAEITEIEARELYQAREALEVYLIPLVIEKLTPEDIGSIKRTFRPKKDALTSGYRRRLMVVDANFHLTIAKLSGNHVILDLLETVMERIYIKYKSEYISEARIANVLRRHHEILNALSMKNTDKAIQLTRDHIRSGMNYMIESLNSRLFASL